MASVRTAGSPPLAASRDVKSWSIALVLAMGATALFPILALANVKLVAAMAAGGVYVLGAALSGNPRLFCVWGLALTLSFDLSKRFGPIIAKMGGESSFRVEMSDPFLLALALFLVRDLWTQRRPSLRIPRAAVLWGLLILVGCGWIVAGPWRMTALHEVVRMVKVLLLFVVLCNELDTPRRLVHCAGGLTLAVIVQSLAGLFQYATRKHYGLELLGETGKGTIKLLSTESLQVGRAFRVGAFLGHPNLFGIFLASLLPLAIALFVLRGRKAPRLYVLAALIVGTAALVATLSRSGWLSFAVAFFVLMALLVVHPGTRQRSLVLAIGPLMAASIVAAIFAGPITQRLFGSRDIAMRGRAEYSREAVALIRARPLLGWGLNSYVFAVPPFTRYGARGAKERFDNWQSPVHNIHLMWWAETGLLGMSLHLAVLAAIVFAGLGNLRARDETLFVVNAACLAGIAAFLVDGFFSFTLRTNACLRVFWVLAAMILAVRYCRLRQVEPAPEAGAVQPS